MESGSDHAAFVSDTESEYIPLTLGGIGDGEAEEFDWWGAEVGDMAAWQADLGVYFSPPDSVRHGDEERERRDGERWPDFYTARSLISESGPTA